MNWFALAVIIVAGIRAFQPDAPSISAVQPDKATACPVEEFDKRLEAIDAAIVKITDLQAEFEQIRRTPLTKKPLVSSGRVRCKGDLVRWDTTKPRESSLLIGHGVIRVFYPEDKLVEEYPVDEGFRDIAGAPLPRLKVLKAKFEVAELATKELGGNDSDKDLLALLLTPKSKELRKYVATVKVLIDMSINAATKIVITDADGDVTETSFRNVKINSGLTTEDVDPKLPLDVRVSRPLGERKAAEPAAKSPAESK